MGARFLMLVPVLTGLALPAAAQTALTLNASGSAQAEPDEAVAGFTVQAVKPDAAGAQAAVNEAMARALAAARAVPGVAVATGGYNSYSSLSDDKSAPQYTAQQNLTLTQPAKDGVPDQAFTALLAKLQGQGLLLTGLNGELSQDGRAKAGREAIGDALGQLRSQAQEIARVLHKKVGALKTLHVNTSGGSVPPMPRMMALAAAAPPPQSAPDKVTVTANVTAEIELDAGN
ncbi:SIMPL domain-containing protein [Acidocella sp.]|uniref:SIMPL domain-containing protein n=1 Tax=Acidocella sp. TaxID=50710 RepID=UPI003D06FE30